MRVLTSGKIAAQGLNGYVKPFLGIAVLSESKYDAAISSRDKSKRHAEQIDFAGKLSELLRKAENENGGYNRKQDGTFSNDYGRMEISMPSSSLGAAHTIQVKIPDNRRNNLLGVLNVLSVNVNFEHKGEEVHVHFHGSNTEDKFSKDNSSKLNGLVSYVQDYRIPNLE